MTRTWNASAALLLTLLLGGFVADARSSPIAGASGVRSARVAEYGPRPIDGLTALAARRRVYLAIGGRWQYRPHRVSQSADFYFDHMRWRTWGGPVARGHGLGEVFNTDTVSYDSYPIAVRLRRRRPCRGAYIYTRIEWTFRGTDPPHFGDSGSNPDASWCRK